MRGIKADNRPRKRHIASIEAHPDSLRRGGSTRTAICNCGWRGPQRASIELAADDALTHEGSDAQVHIGRLELAPRSTAVDDRPKKPRKPKSPSAPAALPPETGPSADAVLVKRRESEEERIGRNAVPKWARTRSVNRQLAIEAAAREHVNQWRKLAADAIDELRSAAVLVNGYGLTSYGLPTQVAKFERRMNELAGQLELFT
jgi:hypothetical protein